MPKMFSPSKMFFKFFFAHENMKKPASKVAEPAQIQPKSQFLFRKNLPPRDFSIMTLGETHTNVRGYHNVYPLTQRKRKKAEFICSAVSKKCSTKSGESNGPQRPRTVF